MKLTELKIFIGPVEIGKIGGTLASAFREKGIKVTAVRHRPTPIQEGMVYDQTFQLTQGNIFHYIVNMSMWSRLFINAFFQHNAFIFLFGKTLLPYNLDLPLLKLFGKKTIMWFLGSDICSYEEIEKGLMQIGMKYYLPESMRESPDEIERKKRMIRRIEKYVDYIISDPPIAHLLNRNYLGKDPESLINLPIDLGKIRYNNLPNTIPIIIHAPTNEEIKGTAYILEAVKRLEKEGYSFDFRLCKDMSNTQVLELLSKGDIAIDQLFSALGGWFADEAMAAGCAVLGGNIPQLSGTPDSPIIHTDPTNVYDNLRLLLENPDLKQELGRKGRSYAEKYLDHRKVADIFLRLLTTDQLDDKS
jgi:glycosyltransferase involved in cell wall biosynthesis